ncbi:MAG: transporter [Wenzhouxiangellaceae bacterium]|nr:MAG: transporter [Wenzhouxiangellaceae bacterium]
MLTRLRQERLLLILLTALPMLVWFSPIPVRDIPGLVHWNTLAALAGLMILSRALEISGGLAAAGRWLVMRLHGERSLALCLVLFAAALSTVLTNDVALFISVPLTLGLRLVARLPLARLVVFQALAVNAGSAISPFGNPQNLFLWQLAEVGIVEFIVAMAPLTAAMMGLLLGLVWLGFSRQRLMLGDVGAHPPMDRRLLLLGLVFYVPFLLAVDAGLALPAVVALLALFAALKPRLLAGIDWLLLLVFLLMFVCLGLLARLPWMLELMPATDERPVLVYALAVSLSQAMSNVPAAIFLADFASDWRALAWGVSVGGFGLAIGSMANLIALRLAREPGIWCEFHCWSIPMLLLATGAGWLLLS